MLEPEYPTYALLRHRDKVFSRYIESCHDKGISNYAGKENLNDRLFDRYKRKRFYRKRWRSRATEIRGKQYRIVMENLKEQREQAFKHHYNPVWFESDFRHISFNLERDEISLWAKENCVHGWNTSLEFPTSNGMDSVFRVFHVYWFEDKDEAMLCRLVFG